MAKVEGSNPFIRFYGLRPLLVQAGAGENAHSLVSEVTELVCLGEVCLFQRIEDLEHTEHAVFEQQGHRHQSSRNVAGDFGDVAREPPVAGYVLKYHRLAGSEHPTRAPCG